MPCSAKARLPSAPSGNGTGGVSEDRSTTVNIQFLSKGGQNQNAEEGEVD